MSCTCASVPVVCVPPTVGIRSTETEASAVEVMVSVVPGPWSVVVVSVSMVPEPLNEELPASAALIDKICCVCAAELAT